MEINAFMELTQKRRNIHRFKPDPVSDEHITTILEAARWAPSGGNTQPWEFIVVKDAENKQAIADIFARVAAAARPAGNPPPRPAPQAAPAPAPVRIVLCADTRFKRASSRQRPEELFYVSIGTALQQLIMAAAALGLSNGFTDVHPNVEAPLKELLNIPDYLSILMILNLGYAAQTVKAPYRREVVAFTHQERVDQAKLRTDGEIQELLATRTPDDIYARRNVTQGS